MCRISHSSFVFVFSSIIQQFGSWAHFEVPPVNAESDVFSVKCLLRPECLVFCSLGLGRKRIWTPPSFNVHLYNGRVKKKKKEKKNAAQESTSVSFWVCVCWLHSPQIFQVDEITVWCSPLKDIRGVCVCVCVWYHTLAAATDRSSVHWHIIIIISSFSTPGIFPVIGISLSFSLSTFSTSRFLSFISPFSRLSFSSTISFCLLSSVLLHPSQSHSKTANLPEIISLKHLLTLTCCVCLFVCFNVQERSSPLAVKHHII